MSGVRAMSLARFEAPAIGVILGWTVLPLGAILGGAVRRTGLCRSATRALGGRLYASRPGPHLGGRASLGLAGIGRRCGKLRGFGGRAPKADTAGDVTIPQVVPGEPDRHRVVQSLLDDYLAFPLAWVDRRHQLVEPVVEPHRVVVGHHPSF